MGTKRKLGGGGKGRKRIDREISFTIAERIICRIRRKRPRGGPSRREEEEGRATQFPLLSLKPITRFHNSDGEGEREGERGRRERNWS